MAEGGVGTITPDSSRPRPGHGPTGRGHTVSPLRRSHDVRAVLRTGAQAGGSTAAVHARRRGDGEPSRVTVVAGRRLGTAVARNRAKRRLRAALAHTDIAPGFDLVVVARAGALTTDYPTLRRALAGAVARATARAEGSR